MNLCVPDNYVLRLKNIIDKDDLFIALTTMRSHSNVCKCQIHIRRRLKIFKFHVFNSRDQIPAVPYLYEASFAERGVPGVARRVGAPVRHRGQVVRAAGRRRHPRQALDAGAREQDYCLWTRKNVHVEIVNMLSVHCEILCYTTFSLLILDIDTSVLVPALALIHARRPRCCSAALCDKFKGPF